jgi:phenylacetate-coenzyme A ligase PaaK-like adenylate-forming protein
LQYVKKRSPFYQNLFASFPEHLDSFTEFEKYPFTTADDIAKEGNRMICVSQSEIARIVTLDTSGTTGKPKRIFFTREDQELTIDFFGVGMSTLIEPGYKVLILLPGNTPGSVGDLLQKGIERVGSIGIQHGPFTDPYATNTRIEALRIQTLVGTPKQVFTLARVWQIAGMKNCPVRSILLSTDYAAPSLMNRIRETWNCSILQHYGMTEAGLGVGIDCAAARGFHLREADLYFELIDSNGLPVPDGSPGEVVLTTLTRKGMPLIRYRSKDISRVIQGDCPCGTVQKTYEWIKKRKDDDPSIISIQQLDDLYLRPIRNQWF